MIHNCLDLRRTYFAAEILMMSMKNFRIHLFCVFYSVTFLLCLYCICSIVYVYTRYFIEIFESVNAYQLIVCHYLANDFVPVPCIE